ncbi:MAG: Coq4 family protein [Thermodesulfobacteriota bacterium]
MKTLLDDPEQTEMAFEVVEALAGKQPQRLWKRIQRDPAGARLVSERPVFDTSTCNLDDLLALPAGSFGRTYAEWMKQNGFRPGLMDREPNTTDPDLRYLGKRLMQVHDFWHVLTGYNRDPIGELGVLAFGWAQAHTYGIGFLIGMVLLRTTVQTVREGRLWNPVLPFVWHAYRTGRRARFLAPLVLEDLFPLPLSEVRGLLGIEPNRERLFPEALPPIAVPA